MPAQIISAGHYRADIVSDPDNPGECLLDLGEEICAALGWNVGDTLQWIDNKDGTWTICKTTTDSIN